jgi:hypothetical protein
VLVLMCVNTQARKMAAAALQLSSGSIIGADATSIISALTDYEASGDTSYANLLLGTPFSCPWCCTAVVCFSNTI